MQILDPHVVLVLHVFTELFVHQLVKVAELHVEPVLQVYFLAKQRDEFLQVTSVEMLHTSAECVQMFDVHTVDLQDDV